LAWVGTLPGQPRLQTATERQNCREMAATRHSAELNVKLVMILH